MNYLWLLLFHYYFMRQFYFIFYFILLLRRLVFKKQQQPNIKTCINVTGLCDCYVAMAATQNQGVWHTIAHFRAAHTSLLYYTLVSYATSSRWFLPSRLHYTHSTQMSLHFNVSHIMWHNMYVLSYRDAKHWGCTNLELYYLHHFA